MAVDTQEAAHVARSSVRGLVATQAVVDWLGLLLPRCMAHALHELRACGQTAPQARLLRSPAPLAVPSVVAGAGEGKTETCTRLSASFVLFGITLRQAPAGHHTGLGRR